MEWLFLLAGIYLFGFVACFLILLSYENTVVQSAYYSSLWFIWFLYVVYVKIKHN